MFKFRSLLMLLGIAYLLMGCQASSIQHNVIKHDLTSFKLLNKEEAAAAVTKDEMEHYFEKVTPLEMSVQLKLESPSGERKQMLEQYRKMLQEDVLDFSPQERKEMIQIFRQALDYCAKVNPDLELPEIHLIKTKGAYYGPSVFYTREHCIVIPKAQLGTSERLLRTLIHEIFHIYSRFNKDKRDALYAAIGYQKLEDIELSDFLKQRILYNPDGVDIRYGIEVQDSSGRSFMAIPAIYTRFSSYRMIPLLQTMVFQLFEVVQEGNTWRVVNESTGYSQEELQNYWTQIGENTTYTIHPDEVLADNFVFLAIAKARGNNTLEQFSPEGKALIAKIEEIVKT